MSDSCRCEGLTRREPSWLDGCRSAPIAAEDLSASGSLRANTLLLTDRHG